MAIQHGRAIFHMSVSYQAPEEGFEHQFDSPLADTPAPEDLPDFMTRYAPLADKLGDWVFRPRPIDTRYVDWEPRDRKQQLPPRQRVWMRADGTLPDDPVLHQCIVTYASDMSLLDTTLLPHAKWHSPDVFMASLDHAMWFHRPFRADEWWLYEQDTPTATGGRGLARGHMWDRSGNLVASVVQEGLIRRMRSYPATPGGWPPPPGAAAGPFGAVDCPVERRAPGRGRVGGREVTECEQTVRGGTLGAASRGASARAQARSAWPARPSRRGSARPPPIPSCCRTWRSC